MEILGLFFLHNIEHNIFTCVVYSLTCNVRQFENLRIILQWEMKFKLHPDSNFVSKKFRNATVNEKRGSNFT